MSRRTSHVPRCPCASTRVRCRMSDEPTSSPSRERGASHREKQLDLLSTPPRTSYLLGTALERGILLHHVALDLQLAFEGHQDRKPMGCEVDRGRAVPLRFLPAHQVEQRPRPVEAFDRLGVQVGTPATALMACLSDVFCGHAELAMQGLA